MRAAAVRHDVARAAARARVTHPEARARARQSQPVSTAGWRGARASQNRTLRSELTCERASDRKNGYMEMREVPAE